MDRAGFCQECPGHCHWSIHINEKYYYKKQIVKKTGTTQELKERYYRGIQGLSISENYVLGMFGELRTIYSDCVSIQEKLKNTINEIQKDALNPNVLSSEEYIDLLINTEQMEIKYGWEKRIEALKNMKEVQTLVKKLKKEKSDEGILSDFEEIKKEIIDKKYDEFYKKAINNFKTKSKLNENICVIC